MNVFLVGKVIKSEKVNKEFTTKVIKLIFDSVQKENPDFYTVYRSSSPGETTTYRCYETRPEALKAMVILIEELIQLYPEDKLPKGYDKVYSIFVEYLKQKHPEILI